MGKAFRIRSWKLSYIKYVCMYVGFKTLFYVVRHLDSTASYLLTGLHLGFFRLWPSLYLPSSFSSVFLMLSFVSASTFRASVKNRRTTVHLFVVTAWCLYTTTFVSLLRQCCVTLHVKCRPHFTSLFSKAFSVSGLQKRRTMASKRFIWNSRILSHHSEKRFLWKYWRSLGRVNKLWL